MQKRLAKFMRRFPCRMYRESMKFDEIKKKEKKIRIDYLETRLLYRYLRININIVKSYKKQAVINGHKLGWK